MDSVGFISQSEAEDLVNATVEAIIQELRVLNGDDQLKVETGFGDFFVPQLSGADWYPDYENNQGLIREALWAILEENLSIVPDQEYKMLIFTDDATD